LVEVPMSVMVPPSTAAYDSGMSNFFAGTPERLLQDSRMGMSSDTTGVLFRKADRMMQGIMTRTSAQNTERERPSTCSKRASGVHR
jgi:hypothetical protein